MESVTVAVSVCDAVYVALGLSECVRVADPELVVLAVTEEDTDMVAVGVVLGEHASAIMEYHATHDSEAVVLTLMYWILTCVPTSYCKTVSSVRASTTSTITVAHHQERQRSGLKCVSVASPSRI